MIKHEKIIASDFLPVKLIFHDDNSPVIIEHHWHRAIEINAMLSWPLSEIFVAGEVFQGETGKIWLTNSMEPHYVKAMKNIPHRQAISIIFPYEYLITVYPDFINGRFEFNNQELYDERQWQVYSKQLFPKMKELYDLRNFSHPSDRLKATILINEILLYLVTYFFKESNQLSSVPTTTELIDRVTQVITYVDSYYNSDIHLEDIANLLHLSRGYTASFLKKYLGMTLGEYVSFIRCQHARNDLLLRNYTQSEIAKRHGFSGLRTMNRQLKKYTGHTAKELVELSYNN